MILVYAKWHIVRKSNKMYKVLTRYHFIEILDHDEDEVSYLVNCNIVKLQFS